MAIDLNKPLGAASTLSNALPTKTSINLLYRERKNRNVWKYVLAGLVLAALVAVFVKFAVFDVFSQVDLKKSELHAAQQELAAVNKQLGNYDRVFEEYRSYTGTTSGLSLDALEVMDMVARVIQPKANVTGASTSEGMLVVNVSDISLDELGKLADTLREEALVESVSVTKAAESTGNQEQAAKHVAATLQIELVSFQEEEE